MARKHSRHGPYEDLHSEAEAPAPVPCWLCGRPTGKTIVWHHPVPKRGRARRRASLRSAADADRQRPQFRLQRQRWMSMPAHPNVRKLSIGCEEGSGFYRQTAKRSVSGCARGSGASIRHASGGCANTESGRRRRGADHNPEMAAELRITAMCEATWSRRHWRVDLEARRRNRGCRRLGQKPRLEVGRTKPREEPLPRRRGCISAPDVNRSNAASAADGPSPPHRAATLLPSDVDMAASPAAVEGLYRTLTSFSRTRSVIIRTSRVP